MSIFGGIVTMKNPHLLACLPHFACQMRSSTFTYIKFALASSYKIFPEKLWFTIESDCHLCFRKSTESNHVVKQGLFVKNQGISMDFHPDNLQSLSCLTKVFPEKLTPKIHWSLVVPKKRVLRNNSTIEILLYMESNKIVSQKIASLYNLHLIRHNATARLEEWVDGISQRDEGTKTYKSWGSLEFPPKRHILFDESGCVSLLF